MNSPIAKEGMKGILSFLTTIIGIGCIYAVHAVFLADIKEDCLIAAFGAAAVLGFSIDEGSLYPLKNMLGGSIIGAVIGVFFMQLGWDKTLSLLLSISCCVLLMRTCKLIYPPGGAIALVPILADETIRALGYLFILCPVLTGISIIFFFSKIQIIINKKL